MQLHTDASPGEIKKQFYKLSKTYHPDVHPDDPNASQRFVKISEAYATLGSAEKKGRYDRDFFRQQAPPSGGAGPRGSYSSASTPAGGRPASGLSSRRTKFQGPPPSFYRSGGWGSHSEKREEHARQASHTYEAQGEAQSNAAGAAGTGPGGFQAGFDNDVPHFNHRGHYQTHSTIEKTRHRARRRQVRPADEELDYTGGSSTLFNFILITGSLTFIFAVSSVFMGFGVTERRGKRQSQEA